MTLWILLEDVSTYISDFLQCFKYLDAASVWGSIPTMLVIRRSIPSNFKLNSSLWMFNLLLALASIYLQYLPMLQRPDPGLCFLFPSQEFLYFYLIVKGSSLITLWVPIYAGAPPCFKILNILFWLACNIGGQVLHVALMYKPRIILMSLETFGF